MEGYTMFRMMLLVSSVAVAAFASYTTRAAGMTDYAGLAPYVDQTCEGRVGRGQNSDKIVAGSGGGMTVNHSYTTNMGGWHTASGLAIRPTGDVNWPFEFVSDSGSQQFYKPATPSTLKVKVIVGGSPYESTYTCTRGG
jgi:hypothetical protein